MKIVIDKNDNDNVFENLRIGDIFMYSNNIDNIFIRVELLTRVTDGKITNAIRLKDGTFWAFSPEDKVQKLDATLTVRKID